MAISEFEKIKWSKDTVIVIRYVDDVPITDVMPAKGGTAKRYIGLDLGEWNK